MSQLDEFHQPAAEGGGADPREAHAPRRQHPSAKEYVRIGMILAALTGLEVWVSYSGLPHFWLIGLLLSAMITKFLLVVLWFMHLRFDDPRYSRFFMLGAVGAFTLFSIVLLTLRVFLR